MPARQLMSVLGAYVILFVPILVVLFPRTTRAYDWVPYLLLFLTALFLVRHLSTRYSIDDTTLHAWRILGGRRVQLEDVRAIEYASLRDLIPTANILGLGSLGWRGRMYSSTIGEFDSVYTDAASGLLITAGAYPLYISPRDPAAFARELSRRVRSYTGTLAKDVGNPLGQ